MKKLVFALIAVLLVGSGVAVGYYFLSNLNSLVAGAIEKHGSQVTETQVGVSGVDISIREGRGSIHGLHVANPEGYSAQDVFTLGNITLDIDLGSVRDNPIVIDEIRVQAPQVHAELTKTGSSNVEELRKRVQAYTSGSAKADSPETEKRIRIKKFVFEEGRVVVDASALGIEKKEIPLPEIHLSNLGGSDGAPADDIAKIVVTTVVKKASSEIARSEIDRIIRKGLGEESLTGQASSLLKKIGG